MYSHLFDASVLENVCIKDVLFPLWQIPYLHGFFSFTIFLKLLRNLKKAEEKVKTAEEDIEENKNKITELQAQLETLENEATTVLKAYKDAQVGPTYL